MADRDSEIERICQAALDCSPASRSQFLAQACGDDRALHRDVERLLAFADAADRFLETQAPTRLGPYEIQAVLGVGGMGEVYRARDTVLGREVALKLLPRALAADPERRERLQREARTLATLNHPNIAHLYGIEQDAMVMELVDGSTLSAPLPIATALDYAAQIAAALEAAHDKGVIHRDLKPTNIMVTPDGTVKVLDFGLAATRDDALDTTSSVPPGDTSTPVTMTRGGAIMGTAAYMSPEQAAGKPVDKRTDIWSFAVVVCELLTGRRLFERETTAGTLAAVITDPIDLRALPQEMPAAVGDLLARCLDRNTRTRLRDIGEARIQIQRALAEAPRPARLPAERLLRAATWVSAALAVLFAVLFAMERRTLQRLTAPLPVTFQIPAPARTTFASGPALSPDGRHVAFTAKDADGRTRIWVHWLESATTRPLAGTEGAFSPLFWSPDGRYVGFAAGEALKKVAISGGPPSTLCDRCGPASIGSRVFRGAAWNAAGVIVYAISSNGLWRVPAAGGTPTRVTPAGDYGYPCFLPDGERLLYTWFGTDPQPGVYLADLRQNQPRPTTRLLDGAFVVSSYAPRDGGETGFLLALREGTLTSRSFDPASAVVSGEPTVIAQNVPTVDPPAAFSTSSTGALAFSSSAAADQSRLVWFDRRGRELGQLGSPSYGSNISISADGAHIVFDTTESDRRTRHIWTADPARNIVTLVNTGPRGWLPAASSSGDVAFIQAPDIYVTRPSATGSAELLFGSPNPKMPNDWSPDGRFLIFNELHPTRRADLYVLDVKRRQQIPLVVTDADEWPAAFSPDAKWIAYSSDETGTREVYVRDFAPGRVPAVGSVRIRVSPRGGDKPRWSRDGVELFYISPDGHLMAAPVRSTSPPFSVGLPTALFEVRPPTTSFPYAAASDRFLVNMLAAPSPDSSGGVTVILNWNTR